MDTSHVARSLHKTNGDGGVPSPRSYALTGKIMLSAIVILFSIVLLILFLHFYVRWHVLRRATRRARRRHRFISAGEGQSALANRALESSILKSLPVILFSSGVGDDDKLEEFDCAVCLDEFKEREKIRCLPQCGHSFHIDCIDMWFSSHSNCPLCRAVVEAVPSTTDFTPASDLCSLCRRDEIIGSSSSDNGNGEVAIEMSNGGIEGLSGQAERVGLEQALKWTSSRVVSLRLFLTRDIRPNQFGQSGTEPNLVSGEGAA